MQSIKSNALEPTRSEWARLSRGQAIVRLALGLWLAHSDAGADRLFLAAASRHVSDLAQRALDPRRQGDHRHAVAGRDLADDGWPHRSHRRLRHRHVAHSRHQPAGEVRRSLAAGDRDRDCLRGRSSASSMACWSRWRRSTRSSPRSAPARSSMRSRFGIPDGRQIVGSLSPGFLAINSTSIFGIPIPALLCPGAGDRSVDRQRAPADRPPHLRHRRQREGRRTQRHSRARLCHRRISSPQALITGFAGCVLGAKLRIGQANVGLDYLLPALVGAFLGSTTIKPGRVNIWGTICRRADSCGRNLRHSAARRRVLCRASFQWRHAGHLNRARGLRSAAAQRRAPELGPERWSQRQFRKGLALNDGFAFRMDGALRCQ